jgi:hypothetical protein
MEHNNEQGRLSLKFGRALRNIASHDVGKCGSDRR